MLWDGDIHSGLGRPSSLPPESNLKKLPAPNWNVQARSVSRPPESGPHLAQRVLSDPQPLSTGESVASETALDLTTHLQRSGPSLVKTRIGSVLSRGFILKTDHYPSGSYARLLPFSPRHYFVQVVRLILSLMFMGRLISEHHVRATLMFSGPPNHARKASVLYFLYFGVVLILPILRMSFGFVLERNQ